MKRFLSWVAVLGGAALITIGWFLWGDRSEVDVFSLNLAVSLAAYIVLIISTVVPLRKDNDDSDRRIGNLSLRIFVPTSYAIAAIAVLVIANLLGLSFMFHLFIQIALLILLIVGIVGTLHSADNIAEVHTEQTINRQHVASMRDEIKALHEQMVDRGDVAAEHINRITAVMEMLRYTAPANTEEARAAEIRFIDAVREACSLVNNNILNDEQLAKAITNVERRARDRKELFSR